MNKTLKCLISALTGVIVFVTSAYAQVTNSSMNGKVTDASGEVVPGAAVIAVHTPSGTQYHAVTNVDGRYFINGMRSGGPYTVEINCLGYQKLTFTDVVLALGDAYPLNAKLTDDTQTLDEAVVVSQASTKFVHEKSGAATNITNADITELPTISRDITDVAKLSPYYSGSGMSFAGSDGRTTNFTVDGASFNNNFGLTDKIPGGGSPISIDAIEEVQVVISPFDVRQAGFVGGGVNAITKSGTNQFKGSAYVYHRNEWMRGDYVEGQAVAGARDKDRTTTYGATLGGPIIKDKLFFFANFEYSQVPTVVNRWRASEDGVANADAYISRVKASDMEAVKNKLAQYGYDTGSYTDFPANESNMKVLARIDWNINNNNKLAVRYNFTTNKNWMSTNATSCDATTRATQGRFSEYGMSFANSMYSMDNNVHTVSLDLNSRITDYLSNQFLATFSMIDDIRGTNSSKFPFIDILDGEAYNEKVFLPYISAGYELFTWNNAVHNRTLNIKDDVTYFLGDHKITAGLSYEYQMADNAYMRNGTGYYRYKSLEDFLNERTPETICMTYGYDNTADPKNPSAKVRYSKAAIYAQDEFNPTDRLKLTAGLRIEGLFFNNKDLMRNNAIWNINNPEGNPVLDQSGNVLALGSPDIYGGYRIDTGKWPRTSIQVSPRIGFVYDILGDNSLKLRGGTGLFTGRLPLVFFTNMPTNSGMVQYQCKIQTDKDYVADPNLKEFAGPILSTDAMLAKLKELGYPSEVHPEDGTLPSSISAVDRKFKMPQVWKTTLALDYAFPTSFPMSLSVEGIFNKTVNQVYIKDYNMKDPEGYAKFNGPDDRYIFPSDYRYTYINAKQKEATSSAYVLSNTNKGYGWNASATFKITPIKDLNFQVTYAHTAQKELTGMPGSDASSAFTYIPTFNGPNRPILHNSSYVEPDRIFANLTYKDPVNNHWSLFLESWRGGANYTYMLQNDMNGDGYNYDVIYIPSDRSQMHFVSEDDAARFWAFVDKDSYLSKVKDNYTEAYSVYNPWTARLDFRWAHDFKIKAGSQMNTIQISFDIKNVLNLFNSDWGAIKYMNPKLDYGRILKYEKMDDQGYPVYSTPKNVNGKINTWETTKSIGQCWYAQIGLKYMFN